MDGLSPTLSLFRIALLTGQNRTMLCRLGLSWAAVPLEEGGGSAVWVSDRGSHPVLYTWTTGIESHMLRMRVRSLIT